MTNSSRASSGEYRPNGSRTFLAKNQVVCPRFHGRAHVRHRLDAVVLGMQRPAELDAQVAGLTIAVQQLVSVHGTSSPGHCSALRV